jgi:hypothetical protein
MAQEESDREDLLREATALVERIELAPANNDGGEHVVAGFRADGALSVYFGSDPAYHFNSRGELRRAFCAGLLVKADAGRLVSMKRQRLEHEVQLIRHPLTASEQAEFIADVKKRLENLARQCEDNALITFGQVPADADVRGRILNWITQHPGVQIASSPHAR